MDLMGGQVVRARHGERHNYRPIASPLCNSSDPLDVAQGLLGLYPFETLYIADLDAIQKRGDHLRTITELRAALPHVEIWLDAGIASLNDCKPWLELGLNLVIGSESLPDIETAKQLIEHFGQKRTLLSLDFVAGRAKGPAALFEDSSLWPQRVIAMTLGRVGSYEGPDFDLLTSLQQRAPGHQIYAAGGVRDFPDLEKLWAMGIAGALLASALHDGKVSREQISRLGK